jgi:hypothetical protein
MEGYVEFCGEAFPLSRTEPFFVGREADLAVDDNPFLHRRFLRVSSDRSAWWLANVGTRLAATLSDDAGLVQAWLAPGAQLPLVFARTSVWFTAGPTTYEFDIVLPDAPFAAVPAERPLEGSTTRGSTTLTPDQRLLLLGLAEPMLRRGLRGAAAVPPSAEVAARLGWPLTKFNRKLDNVCDKLTRLGVRGLHGGPANLAMQRKARLVEYALAARLVRYEDLGLLGGSELSSAAEVGR